MTDRPYTDADLRHEAARQHALCAWDPDIVSVGEAMEDAFVERTKGTRTVDGRTETVGMRWAGLLPHAADDGAAYSEAQRKIHDLINGAADVSAWAINLGADGLEPHETALTLDATTDGKPRVVVLFAFADDLPEETRRAYIDGVHHAHREGL